MLYECNVEYILIEKEIKLIKNYIDLEKLRYGKRLTLNLSINGNTSGKKIAPMLILPFVENSFKHGTSKKSKTVEIKIELKVENKRLKLLVENTKSASQNDNKLSYEEGIGLKNVKKRLELIYKNQYTLDIIEEGEMYIVKLDLDLNRDMTSPKSSP
ncbi:MAG: sensor histidine kinase, partial [bacterium]|nr:sensor histidine kinase [bacterium]